MGILAVGCVLTGIFPGLALMPVNSVLLEYGLAPLDVGLSGVLSGPGAWNATGMFVMMALAFLAGYWFVRRFTRLREIDVHACGLPPEIATSRMAPSSISRRPDAPAGRRARFQGEPLMSDTLLAILHMCIFPGGAFALAVGFFFKGLDRRVEAASSAAWARP